MIESTLENDIILEILISTMNRTSLSFLEKMFPNQELDRLNLLVINQTQIGNELDSNYKNIRVINSFDKGLSLSRNLALKNAAGEICLVSDDDVEYLPNFLNTIVSAFSRLKGASVIRFKIETFTGVAYKTYPKTSKSLNTKKDIESASSIELAFKRKDIISNNITFNSLFGLGSRFQSGEEYLFLQEILKKGLNIYFENEAIVKHSFERSTSNMGSENFIKTQAALYYHDYQNLSYLFLLKFIIFLVRKKIVSLNEFVPKYKLGVSAIKIYKELDHGK